MAKLTVKAVKQYINSGFTVLIASVAPADNVYVAGGVQLNLSPGQILDPSALGVTGPSQTTAVVPGIFSQNMQGYTAAVVPPTTTGSAGLSTYKLQYFQPSGAELAAGAYPAGITAGYCNLNILH